MSPVNMFELAFGALLNVQQAVFGERKKATIGGVEVDAVIGTLSFDEILIAGGIAENGGFEIQVAATALSGLPDEGTEVIAEGVTNYVLRRRNANGIYTLTCGDPAAGD